MFGLEQPYAVSRLANEAMQVKGVKQVEGWIADKARRVRTDGSESNILFLNAVPAKSPMLNQIPIEGRWLSPEDKNAIVVIPGFLGSEPDVHVGSEIILKIEERKVPFKVIGVVKGLSSATFGYTAYVNYPFFSHITNTVRHANTALIQVTPNDADTLKKTASQLEKIFERQGIKVRSVVNAIDEREEIGSSFGILTNMLLVMVTLLALVGGLGLTGTMSLNVIERSREIGVMRAYGGSNRSIFTVVMVESLAIGLMSWLLAVILAAPLSRFLDVMIGMSFVETALDFSYSIFGAGLWLFIVVLVSIIASLLPARNAVRLTVREILAYE
jgi:putative ABC transport system permease protein